MSYAQRLKKLASNWSSTKPAKGGGAIPAGKYQLRVDRAVLEESKANHNQGNMQVTWHLSVATGKLKGRKLFHRRDLEFEGDEKAGVPTGLAMFFGDLEALEIPIPKKPSPKGITSALESAVGSIVDSNVTVNKGYNRIYLNRLVNASDEEEEEFNDEELEEEETEEVEEDEEEAEDEDEEEEEEEEKPKPSKKKSKKKASKKSSKKKSSKKKSEPEPEDEDEEDGDDWDDDEWDD